MKTVCQLNHISQLESVKNSQFDEVLIGHKDLARFGRLESQEFLTCLQSLKEMSKRIVLQWDILMVEECFVEKAGLIHSLDLSLFDAIRVQDPGALEFCLRKTNLPIQLILETGNRNLESIKKWIELCEGRCERIILSIELPETKIEEFVQELSVDLELLVFGRIPLFYSPRSLVKDLFEDEGDWIEVSGNSEESPHKGFPIIENQHGTFMLNTKDLNLLGEKENLHKLGLSHIRIEIDDLNTQQIFDPFDMDLSTFPRPFIKGFYRTNKTDVLFKKLKNQRLQDRGESYIGEVVEVEKKSHLAILIKNEKRSLKMGDQIRLLTPEGNEKNLEVLNIKNVSGDSLENAHRGQVVLLNPVGGISVKTLVYWLD